MRPSAIECLLCGGNEYVRKYLQNKIAKRLLSQKFVLKSDFKIILARIAAPNGFNYTFNKYKTAVIYETDKSRIRIIDLMMPINEELTSGSSRMQLFVVCGAV